MLSSPTSSEIGLDLHRVRATSAQVITVGREASADTLLKATLNIALSERWVRSDSRNGPVMRAPGLFITSYDPDFVPVMNCPIRDANPFLHYVEAFYYLCGRKDVGLMAYFAAQMKEYSDDGTTLWGSYGYRWRGHFSFDQLNGIICELKRNPTSRRCVLQMWDGFSDFPKAMSNSKDVPCNHVATFDTEGGRLNMTVTNRSNDLIWGTYGANMVHFNVMLAYVAAMTDLPKGVYHQVSSNTHVYLEFPITKRFIDTDADSLSLAYASSSPKPFAPVEKDVYRDLFLGEDPQVWEDSEIHLLNNWLSLFSTAVTSGSYGPERLASVQDDLRAEGRKLFTSTGRNLTRFMLAYASYKAGNRGLALEQLTGLSLDDPNPFFLAGLEWMERRKPSK